MKILLFIDNLGPGGAQRQICGLAVMLCRHGHNVKVCTYYPHDFYKDYLDQNKVTNEIIPGADNPKKRIWVVRKYFKQEQPDWVIAYQETPSLVACVAKILGCDFKLIVSERNTTQKVGMNERVRFFLYRWADAIVPNSHAQERWLYAHHPWMKQKITTITNFVDLDKFHIKKHVKNEIPEILVVGSIFGSKNTKGYIQACKILKDKGVKFHTSWYGWMKDVNSYMLEVKELIKELDLEDVFTIEDKTENIVPVYQKADYYCMPSFFEGTPNVLCEAIACGLPVASSDICDNGLYVEDEINGYLFNPSDVDEMAFKIEKLLTIDKEHYLNFSKNSRSIAEEKLSMERFYNEYRMILEK